MYRFLALLLTCIYMCNVFAHPNIISMPRTVEEQIQQEERDLETDSQAAKYLSLNSNWLHTIVSVKKKGKLIELEDGSFWAIPWYWQGTSAKWAEGDVIVIKFDFTSFVYETKLRNVTQGSLAWADVYKGPDYRSTNLKSIQSIQDDGSVLELQDGTKLRSDKPGAFKDWSVGDLLLTALIVHDFHVLASSYVLGNVSKLDVSINLTVES